LAKKLKLFIFFLNFDLAKGGGGFSQLLFAVDVSLMVILTSTANNFVIASTRVVLRLKERRVFSSTTNLESPKLEGHKHLLGSYIV